MTQSPDFQLTCPVPRLDYPRVLLAHGGGGLLTHRLIEQLFMPAFANPALADRHDGARLDIAGARLAFSTDSYVVHPLFFPGGDIGSLAVNGTVNDLAMCGARPLYLSAGFIIEEGLETATLTRIVDSMRRAAAMAGVQLVTGDTKVVDRGKGDGLYLNTAGIGVIEYDAPIHPRAIRPGDAILLSGDVGRHGIAIMAQREGLAFETAIESDCAPLAAMVGALLAEAIGLHCLRDCTRGGLATTLVEIAQDARVLVALDERAVPIEEAVRGACELLGLDPLYVANEGRMVLFVDPGDAERALDILRRDPAGTGAVRIGTVESTGAGRGAVHLRSAIGASRILDMLSGEQLPRIC